MENHNLVKINETSRMLEQFSAPSGLPRWTAILHALARDKHHDLSDGQIALWKAKLENVREQDIELALIQGRWPFFPTCDEVLDLCDRYAAERRERLDYERQHSIKREMESARKQWEDPARQNWLRELARSIAAKLRGAA